MNNDTTKYKRPLDWWKIALMYIALIFIVTVLISLVNRGQMFYNLAGGIIISWIISLVTYYVWAIRFYNINMGWTDEDWIVQEKMKRLQPDAVEDEPVINPNAEETLGLPPGTVRATIALTLLIGALALMLASLELPNVLEQNRLYIDNYDFIKTAILMMVAFYFGDKSLKYLKSENTVHHAPKIVESTTKSQFPATLDSPVSNFPKVTLPTTSSKNHEIIDDGKTEDFDETGAQG